VAAAVVALLGALWWVRRDPRPHPSTIPRWDQETVARLSEGGWSETFERHVSRPTPLPEYDPRWQRLFGSLEVVPEFGAAAGSEGFEDGGDDYAFYRFDPPMGNVEITLDGWWGGEWRSLGVQGVVQPDPPHRLYEAALWEGAFSIFYFEGPLPSDYLTLGQVEVGELPRGFYRIRFRNEHDGEAWRLTAELIDLESGRSVAEVEGRDARLPSAGYQGMGVLSGRRTMVTGMAVRRIE
jgi:hypothetical protein